MALNSLVRSKLSSSHGASPEVVKPQMIEPKAIPLLHPLPDCQQVNSWEFKLSADELKRTRQR
jgi:hypothetical protein